MIWKCPPAELRGKQTHRQLSRLAGYVSQVRFYPTSLSRLGHFYLFIFDNVSRLGHSGEGGAGVVCV